MNDDIYNKVEDAIYRNGQYKRLKISYDMDNDLDDVLTQGKVLIEYATFQTNILINPTYLDIVVVLNDLINLHKFEEQHYLENIYFVRNDHDIQVYHLFFGS